MYDSDSTGVYSYTKWARLEQENQLFCSHFHMHQDIFLKLSGFVHHMSALNWQKNLGHCFISQPATAHIGKKLWWPLATVIFEIFWNEKNWGGFRPFPVTHWKEIWKYWKKWHFEIFQKLAGSYYPCPRMKQQLWQLAAFIPLETQERTA